MIHLSCIEYMIISYSYSVPHSKIETSSKCLRVRIELSVANAQKDKPITNVDKLRTFNANKYATTTENPPVDIMNICAAGKKNKKF